MASRAPRYWIISVYVSFFDCASSICANVGEWERGIIRTCPGKVNSGGLIAAVVRGPFAVVRYASVPIDTRRCFANVGLERQKKQDSGPGGGRGWQWCPPRPPPPPRPRLPLHPYRVPQLFWLWSPQKKAPFAPTSAGNPSAVSALGSGRFLLPVSPRPVYGDSVVLDGRASTVVRPETLRLNAYNDCHQKKRGNQPKSLKSSIKDVP